MTANSSEQTNNNLTRRELLELGATAAVAAPTLMAAASFKKRNQPHFLVKPYVQFGDAPQVRDEELMQILWHAPADETSWNVEFRRDGSKTWTQAKPLTIQRVAVVSIAPHHVCRADITGLVPGKPFEYRVLKKGQPVFTAKSLARKKANQPYRFVVMGDCGFGSEGQKEVAYQVYQRKPEFIFIPGDIIYSNGRISEYRNKFYPVYSAENPSPQAGAPLLESVPFLGGLGQHDTGANVDTYADGFAYYMYWSFPLNGPITNSGDPNAFPLAGAPARERAVLNATGDRYPRMANYSFDYGNSHWTVLDTWNPHCDWNDEKLRRWLRDDLIAAKNATWKFVSSYLPPFNSSTVYPHTQKMRVIADIVQEAKVDIVFSGYVHSYQRTYPLTFTADPKLSGPVKSPTQAIEGRFEFDKKFDGKKNTTTEGVLYVVSGGGGATLHGPEQTDNPKTWQPYTVKFNASVHQFSDLKIDGDRLELRQIDQNGKQLDSFVMTKS